MVRRGDFKKALAFLDRLEFEENPPEEPEEEEVDPETLAARTAATTLAEFSLAEFLQREIDGGVLAMPPKLAREILRKRFGI